MNFGDLTSYLANYILRRPDLNAQPELLKLAVNVGHRQLQNDGDFRCMEAHTPIVYQNATSPYGIAMPAYSAGPPAVLPCKRLRNVWNTTGTTFTVSPAYIGTPIPTSPIIPATESEVNNLANIAQQTRGIIPSAATNTQRWFEKELQVCLFYPPATDSVLMVDYYGFLPDYVNPTDLDWFSENVWLCLLYCAAWQGSISLFEDQRAQSFMGIYQSLLTTAISNDKMIKQGGMPQALVAPPTVAPQGAK